MKIGILHPGDMGASIAQALVSSGHEVAWCSAGRGDATRRRTHGLREFGDLQGFLTYCVDGVISVCPPAVAYQQATDVAAEGYTGVYVDANAVSPATARQINNLIGAGCVDGGIIGPPARRPGTTRLYVSGPQASAVCEWFTLPESPLQAIDLGDQIDAASALKMAYAAYTKGSSALLLAVNALARHTGVEGALREEWALSQPDLHKRSELTARGTAPKAWRFAGEMQEIAQTFDATGLSGEFHLGAADLYQRMAVLKDESDVDLEQVLQTIVQALPDTDEMSDS